MPSPPGPEPDHRLHGAVQPGAQRLHGGGCLHGGHPHGGPSGAVLDRVRAGRPRDCAAGLLRRHPVAAVEGPLLLDLHAVRELHHVPADREVGKPDARHRWASWASPRPRASGHSSSARRCRSTTWCWPSWRWACGSCTRIVRSLLGPHLHGVRNSDDLAEALGIRPDAHQALSFVLSVVYAGLAGALYAGQVRFLGPGLASVRDLRHDDVHAGGRHRHPAGPLLGTFGVPWLTQ
jgi:hypothetical protein